MTIEKIYTHVLGGFRSRRPNLLHLQFVRVLNFESFYHVWNWSIEQVTVNCGLADVLCVWLWRRSSANILCNSGIHSSNPVLLIRGIYLQGIASIDGKEEEMTFDGLYKSCLPWS